MEHQSSKDSIARVTTPAKDPWAVEFKRELDYIKTELAIAKGTHERFLMGKVLNYVMTVFLPFDNAYGEHKMSAMAKTLSAIGDLENDLNIAKRTFTNAQSIISGGSDEQVYEAGREAIEAVNRILKEVETNPAFADKVDSKGNVIQPGIKTTVVDQIKQMFCEKPATKSWVDQYNPSAAWSPFANPDGSGTDWINPDEDVQQGKAASDLLGSMAFGIVHQWKFDWDQGKDPTKQGSTTSALAPTQDGFQALGSQFTNVSQIQQAQYTAGAQDEKTMLGLLNKLYSDWNSGLGTIISNFNRG